MNYIKKLLILSVFGTLTSQSTLASDRADSTIILSEQAVQNLKIQSIEVTEQDFEKTLFVIGRIEEIPANRSVVSTRVAGRVVELNVFEGDVVEEGDSLMTVESRQLGDPPPVIELLASRAGIVVSSHVRLGQPVSPDSELMDIVDQSLVWAVAKIPEQEASRMKIGIAARLHIPALGDQELKATLTRFGVSANRDAGTVDGIFQIENPEQKLRSGMRAEFSIVLQKRSDVLAVPRTAIQGDPINRILFIKDFDLPNAFIRSPVVLGEQNDKYVEILSGLFPGDEVVTHGSYALSFSSGGSGISLKEALDLAHGHEHNEDGSEITEEQRRQMRENTNNPEDKKSPWLLFYSIGVSVAFLITLQLLLKKRSTSNT